MNNNFPVSVGSEFSALRKLLKLEAPSVYDALIDAECKFNESAFLAYCIASPVATLNVANICRSLKACIQRRFAVEGTEPKP